MDRSKSGKKRKRRSSKSSRTERVKEARKPQLSVYSSLRSRLTPSGKVRRLSLKEKTLLYFLAFACLCAITLSLLIWQSRNTADLQWDDPTRLPETSAGPVFVSSGVDSASSAYIEPLLCRGSAEYALDKIEEIIRSDDNYRYIRREKTQLQAIAVTPWLGFQEDVIFQTRSDPERIEIYSASRVGPTDLDSNRNRLEELRELLQRMRIVK